MPLPIFRICGKFNIFKRIGVKNMDRRVKKTKKAIQEAYFSLLMEKDTPKITITELTKRADIDRKTFYLHYETVDDIVTEAIENQIEQLRLILKEENYFEHPLNFDIAFQSINRLLEQDLTLFRHIAKNKVFRDFWDQFQEILAKTMIDVYRDISTISREELEISAKFYSAGIVAIYADWLNHPEDLPLDRLGQLASKMLREGIPDLVN
jgi:AcrR family transcriptional regulator